MKKVVTSVLMLITLLISTVVLAYEGADGRISDLSGKIFIQTGRSLDWLEGYVNSPIQEGDRIWTDMGAVAELQTVGGRYLRLDEDTKVDLMRLYGSGMEAKLWLGSVYVRARSSVDQNEVTRINTPDGTIALLSPGLVRIDILSNGNTLVRVYEGMVELSLDRERITLRNEEQVSFRQGRLEGRIERFNPRDGDTFHRYNEQRDLRITSSDSGRYVADDLSVGSADLDYYGVWVYDASFGYCWRPRMYAGWVPYRYGRWVWTYPWGWTWVSLEPWGWLPYHYGYWTYSSYYGWIWVPDRYWAPAWVAWTYYDGYVGWVPLHPYDVHDHHWRANAPSRHHVHWQSNANIRNPYNTSLHIGVNAATHISRTKLVNGAVIRKSTDHQTPQKRNVEHWGMKLPEEIKPGRSTIRRIPSKSLQQRSTARKYQYSHRSENRKPYTEKEYRSTKTSPYQDYRSQNKRNTKEYDSRVKENKATRHTDRSASPDKSHSISSYQNSNDSTITIRRSYSQRTPSSPSYRQPYSSSTSPSKSRNTRNSNTRGYSSPSQKSSTSYSRSSSKSSSSTSKTQRSSNKSSRAKSSKSSNSKSSKSSKSSSSSSNHHRTRR